MSASSTNENRRLTDEEDGEDQESGRSGDTQRVDDEIQTSTKVTETKMGNQPLQKPSAPTSPPGKFVRPPVSNQKSSARPVQRIPAPRPGQTTTSSLKQPVVKINRQPIVNKEERKKSPESSRYETDDEESDQESRNYKKEVKITKTVRSSKNKPSKSRDDESNRSSEQSSEESSRPKKRHEHSEKAKKKKEEEKKVKEKAKAKKQGFDKETDEKGRFDILSTEDLKTATFYILPKPKAIYVVTREPETFDDFNDSEYPSESWSPITSFFHEKDAVEFCIKENRRCYDNEEFTTPYPERGYVYWKLRIGERSASVAENYVNYKAKKYDRQRKEYIAGKKREATLRKQNSNNNDRKR